MTMFEKDAISHYVGATTLFMVFLNVEGSCSDSLTHLSIFQKPTTITPAHHAQPRKHLMYAHLTYLTSYWFPPF